MFIASRAVATCEELPSLLDTDVMVLMFGALITFWQRSVSVAVGVSIEDTDVHLVHFPHIAIN